MLTDIKIGNLAKATDTKPTTIRFYEKIGLLEAPERTSGNYRNYGEDHLRRLVFIRRARDLGFSIKTIQMLLAFSDNPDQTCSRIIDMVSEQQRTIEQKISDLKRLSSELGRLSQQCNGVGPCRIIEALYP